MTVLIIGSNSFSGASFVKLLLQEGRKVIGVSRSKEVWEPFRPYTWDTPASLKNFEFKQIDLNKNMAELISLIKQKKPKIIVNFAAQSMVGQSWEIPNDWYNTNVMAFSELMQAMCNLDFLENYIHFSTPEVYGSTEGIISEEYRFNPTTPYAISRAAGDFMVRAYRDNFSMPSIITRASNVYGPGQQLYRIIPKTIATALNHGNLTLDGGGKSDRDFIYIDDVSSALLSLLSSKTASNEFHISTENQITIHRLVEIIFELVGADFEDHVIVGPDRIGKDKSYHLSSKNIFSQTGWKPRISLERGIAEVIDWYKTHEDLLASHTTEYKHKA